MGNRPNRLTETRLPCTYPAPAHSPRRAHPASGRGKAEPDEADADLPYTSLRQPEFRKLSTRQSPYVTPPRRRAGEIEHWEIEAKDGLPSADRNNKATLLLTGPFRTAKSSAKDLTPLVLKLQYAKYRGSFREPWRNRLLRR